MRATAISATPAPIQADTGVERQRGDDGFARVLARCSTSDDTTDKRPAALAQDEPRDEATAEPASPVDGEEVDFDVDVEIEIEIEIEVEIVDTNASDAGACDPTTIVSQPPVPARTPLVATDSAPAACDVATTPMPAVAAEPRELPPAELPSRPSPPAPAPVIAAPVTRPVPSIAIRSAGLRLASAEPSARAPCDVASPRGMQPEPTTMRLLDDSTAAPIPSITPAPTEPAPMPAAEPTTSTPTGAASSSSISNARLDATVPTITAAPSAPNEAPPPVTLAREPAAAPPHSDAPVILARAEDLAIAIERLRPIPRGGATLELETPGLGPLRLHVRMEDGVVRVRIHATTPEAAIWLAQERDGLTAAARGAVSSALGIELDLRDGSNDTSDRRPGREPMPSSPTPNDAPTTTASRAATPSAPAPARARGLVDVVA